MIKIETLAGDTFDFTAWKAYKEATETKEPVTFDFNGIRFIVYKK